MAFLVHFTTARFDVSTETPNPVNPIAGQTVLPGLKARIAVHGVEATEPDTEGWGWNMDFIRGEADEARVEPLAQIHPQRSLTDRLLGHGPQKADGPLFVSIAETVRRDPDVTNVETDADG